MTDKTGVSFETAHMAVQLKELEGEHKLIAAQLAGSVQALTSGLQALQVESRAIVAKLQDLASLQGLHDTNKEIMQDVKKSVVDMGARLERWIDDERKERDEWQLRHEADNENDHRSLEDRIGKVQGKLAQASGAVAVVVLLGGTIVGGFLWSINERFTTAANTMDKIATAVNRNADNIEELDDRVRDIEIYLARGGHNPNDPYTQPRKDDGKR